MSRIIFTFLIFATFLFADSGSVLATAQENKQEADVMPVPVNRVNPAYPDSARRAGIEGMVHLQVFVDQKGFVKEVKVVKNDSGSEMLEIAAMKAALDWQFQPAVKDGKPVGVYVMIPFRFKLSKDNANK